MLSFAKKAHLFWLYGWAVSRFKEGNFKEAVQLLDQYLQHRPQDGLAIFNRGVAKFDLGQLEAALEDFQAAAQCQDDPFEAHLNMGDTLFRLGRLTEAASALETALAWHPQKEHRWPPQWTLSLKLADIYLGLQDFHKASDCLSDIPLENMDAKLWLKLAWVYRKIGDHESAAACDQNAIIFEEGMKQQTEQYVTLIESLMNENIQTGTEART